jgi:hypothetical protein
VSPYAIERHRVPFASPMRLQEQRDAVAGFAEQREDLPSDLASMRHLFVAYVATRDQYRSDAMDAGTLRPDTDDGIDFTDLQLQLLTQPQSCIARMQIDPSHPGDYTIRLRPDEYDRYLEWRFGERAVSSLEDRFR